jgi:hypothetical protein
MAAGAVATYLALERPWQGPPASDEESIATAGAPDAGVTPTRRGKRRRPGGGGGGAGPTLASDEPFAVDPEIVLTEADRRLEWRGDAVALPPRTVDMAGGDDARPLDDGEIQGGIARGSSPVIACIQDATAGAALAAELTVQLLVGGDGKVDKVRVRAPAWLHQHGLLACVRRAAKSSMAFPGTGAPTIVTAPFHLE